MPRTPAGPHPATGTLGVSDPRSLPGVATLPIQDVKPVAAVREAIRGKLAPGSQLSAQNVNTMVAGKQMRIGGELRVSTTHIELSRAEINGIFDALKEQLTASSADRVVIDTIDSEDRRSGRKLFEYVRDAKGQFRYGGTRVPNYSAPLPTQGSSAPAVVGVGAANGALEKQAAQTLSNEINEAMEKRVASKFVQVEEKALVRTASEVLSAAGMSAAERRLGKAVTPIVGLIMVGPDALRGLEDLSHGHFVTGLGTIGVAIAELAGQGLHMTNAVTGLGGSALAVTIQVWCATMQFSWETARVEQRSSDLKAYMEAHGNELPPDSELRSYYGLKDPEQLMIFKDDVAKAANPTVTTEQLRAQVRGLLAELDAAGEKPLPDGASQHQLAQERGSLNKLLGALESKIDEDRRAAAAERVVNEEKRRQENFDRAQQQLAVPPPRSGMLQLLPGPSPQRPPGVDLDPFGLFVPPDPNPFGLVSASSAELCATGFGRARAVLIERHDRLEAMRFPTLETSVFRQDVANYVDSLDRFIAEFMKKGSPEWLGVKELRRLRHMADEDDRHKLLR